MLASMLATACMVGSAEDTEDEYLTGLRAFADDDVCGTSSTNMSCATKLLQIRSAKIEEQRGGGSADRPKELVYAAYTFGAPGTHSGRPFSNNASPDGCFRGVRSYTEDLANHGVRKVDAAAMFIPYPHMLTNTLILRYPGDSIYVPCNGSSHGHPDWPLRRAGMVDSWDIHEEEQYYKRLQHVVLNGTDVSRQEPFSSARLFMSMAFRVYETDSKAGVREFYARDPSYARWKGVGGFVYEDPNGDRDKVVVGQNLETLDCVVIFEGTDTFSELFTSVVQHPTGYCGFDGVHAGYRNELWTLSGPLWQAYVKPKLGKCRRVTCTGHSLGGALCEIFAACANSGHVHDPDYQRLVWTVGSPEKMPEENFKPGGGTIMQPLYHTK